MSTASKTSFITFDDFCSLVKDGQKADLIDGVIYMASPDNTDANKLNAWLCTLMTIYVRQIDLGQVFVSRVAFRLDNKNGPEPDIGFVRKRRFPLIERGFVDGPPDLAVEIVSPDSIERDYGKKRDQYERFGVEEYWIIDEVKEKITLLRLPKTGRYREVRPKKGALHSQVLPGFYLRGLGLEIAPFTVCMTGCPNGCARPYNSDIGLVGKTKDKYTIFVGGRLLGDRLNFIYKDLVPTAEVVRELVPLLAYFKQERLAGESFGDFCFRKGQAELHRFGEEMPR